ncbi:aminotransferase class I/II-fold pyridoxal phosphate-dependent enzyme, partial [Phenylobacterium sp.]|uniref:aminotransferase class I/II-fold pyridoxal phosphate-dependent enzyme n=1 Tax=Phenylobacterium sp. TaxID=1871053 RepID=UPI002734B183
YGGHAEAWSASGAQVREIATNVLAAVDGEVIVLVNPNNPDGAMTPPAALLEIAKRQAGRGGWLIVDESFCDMHPQLSVAPWAGGGLVVLRSFGKFYGLAGVRLGFALGEPTLIARLRSLLGDWPVSAEAIAAGAAYADGAWAQRARRWLKRQAQRLDGALAAAGFEIVGGTTLFRLTRSPHAGAWFRHLAERGLLVRPFRDQPQWLRFGLPPVHAWPRLTQAFEEFRP